MEVTKREIIISIAIIAIMLVFGFSISDSITRSESEQFAKYNKALHITDTDLFKHCMDTNSGYAFVYGDLVALDPVTFEEIGGNYYHVKKVKEKYRMHTRTVTKTKTVNGKTQTYTEIETYWSWDEVKTWREQCKTVSFCGVEFSSNRFDSPYATYIDTIREDSNTRYKYYGAPITTTGTVFTELKDGTINESNHLYMNTLPEELQKSLTQSSVSGFWVGWIVLIIVVVVGFYSMENYWLER